MNAIQYDRSTLYHPAMRTASERNLFHYETEAAGHDWAAMEAAASMRVGKKIDVYAGDRAKKNRARVKATVLKAYKNFVLANVHLNPEVSYKESFLYVDFVIGIQPENGLCSS